MGVNPWLSGNAKLFSLCRSANRESVIAVNAPLVKTTHKTSRLPVQAARAASTIWRVLSLRTVLTRRGLFAARGLIVTACALALITSVNLSGCANNSKRKLTSIKTAFNIKVKDPVLKQLTNGTQDFVIDATGEFTPGTYVVRGTPIQIADGTTFKLSLKMPITDPEYISTADASGKFETTKPLVVRGVALPKQITIDGGKLTAEFDFVQILGTFLINVLQLQALTPAEGSDIQEILRNLNIQVAQLNLRPNAKFQFGPNRIHAGPNSSICLANLLVDKDNNYQGSCRLNLHFASDSAYVEDKVEARFNGGAINETVSVSRKNGAITLAPMATTQKPKVMLNDCTYKFGKDKASNAHCNTSVINIEKFDWTDYEADNQPSDYHFQTLMDLTGTRLQLRYPTYTVDAMFNNTEHANLDVFHDKSDHGLDFGTKDVLATAASIKIIRPTTSITLDLENAHLGNIEFAKSGEVDFELSEGTSQLRACEWSNGKKSFRLDTDGGSTLAVTQGTPLSLNKDHPGAKMRGVIPLQVKLGKARLTDAAANMLEFSKVNGQIEVDIDKEISLTGKADISIAQCDLLGDTPADVDIRGFKLQSGDGKAVMSLAGCTIVLPRGTITSVLKKELPQENAFSFKKDIFDEKRWRYKHAVISKLIVRKPLIQKLNLDSPGKVSFTVDGDVEVDGTVDKTGIFGAFKKDPQKWVTKEWKAFSHCTGSGVLQFKIVPQKTLADCDMVYDLDLQMPLPQDIEVDWSKVATGIVGKAETSAISGYLNDCEPFHGTRTIPYKHKGTLKLFQARSEKLKAISISKFDLKPTPAGTEIHFVGEAKL